MCLLEVHVVRDFFVCWLFVLVVPFLVGSMKFRRLCAISWTEMSLANPGLMTIVVVGRVQPLVIGSTPATSAPASTSRFVRLGDEQRSALCT